MERHLFLLLLFAAIWNGKRFEIFYDMQTELCCSSSKFHALLASCQGIFRAAKISH